MDKRKKGAVLIKCNNCGYENTPVEWDVPRKQWVCTGCDMGTRDYAEKIAAMQPLRARDAGQADSLSEVGPVRDHGESEGQLALPLDDHRPCQQVDDR